MIFGSGWGLAFWFVWLRAVEFMVAKIETCFVVLKELSAETGEHASIGGAVAVIQY